MTDPELDQLLQRARVPERPPEFWERFPRRVLAGLRTAPAATAAAGPGYGRWLWGLGLATACLLFSLAPGLRHDPPAPPHPNKWARAQTVFQELSALFPHRLRAIVMDESGLRLVLSEAADVPVSPPVWVEICAQGNCRDVITFSGEQVNLNGEQVEVLNDARGNILVIGPHWAWSSAPSDAAAGRVRIQARRLGGLL